MVRSNICPVVELADEEKNKTTSIFFDKFQYSSTGTHSPLPGSKLSRSFSVEFSHKHITVTLNTQPMVEYLKLKKSYKI